MGGNRAVLRTEHREPQRQRLGRVMLIYIIETPKDSLRLSFGLAVSCALSRLWYYCEPFAENHEWQNEEIAKNGNA